ncbi:hypothetical protein SAMN04488128_1011083 [Chitinophaga eiseniae]|uniref:Uncharacterized protein n=1 Tax=Chitinophaga eiseniae TaxID=634771 RepID=A0A1T4MFL1_9BACT|nr:hypothetical protein SAMN04488128_1011083 [Chitinophaga eiseniae]
MVCSAQQDYGLLHFRCVGIILNEKGNRLICFFGID